MFIILIVDDLALVVYVRVVNMLYVYSADIVTSMYICCELSSRRKYTVSNININYFLSETVSLDYPKIFFLQMKI